jgi:hypothetical protein
VKSTRAVCHGRCANHRFHPRAHYKHRVDNATIKALQERFGDFELIELTGTIGYYAMLTFTANACELEPAPARSAKV